MKKNDKLINSKYKNFSFVQKSLCFSLLSLFYFTANAQKYEPPVKPKPQTKVAPLPAKESPILKPQGQHPATNPPVETVATPSENIPHGKDLVSIDFPNGVNLSDIIKTIGVWTGKNFILGQGVSGTSKIAIISQEPVTKEEGYQAFLSALNISGYTTVETGKIVKILPVSTARSSNIKTYYGENWAPATDEVINQVIPMRYIDVNLVVSQLRNLIGMTPYAPFTTTNSLILTDTGNRIRRILEVIKLLDNKTSQSQVSIIAINYSDAKEMATKVTEIFGGRSGTSISLQKALVDERTNSVILVGPAHTLDDIVRFIQKVDKPSLNQSSQALIRVRPLDYADAEKLAQTLQALSQNSGSNTSGGNNFRRPPQLPQIPNAASPQQPQNAAPTAANLNGTKITADKSTNSLIIEGSSSAYHELNRIISQLDRRKAQVYIEANIIDLNMSNDLEWAPSAVGGAKIGSKAVVPFGFNAINAGTAATDASKLVTSASSNAILGIFSNKPINIGGMSLTPGALIFALKTDVNNNVLQTPSMMVSDNETANFNSATEYYVTITVPSSTAGVNTTSQQKYDVTTSLKVKPQISRSNYVNLQISLELDDAGLPSADKPFPTPIYKRSADSVVTVQDGQTAVLGGITKNSIKRSESKVPLLGDIPILGWLFKTESNLKEKTNLTLFVTPHIVRDADDLAKIYDTKIKARDEFLKAFYGKDFKEEGFYSNLPKLEDGQVNPDINSKNKIEIDKDDGLNEFLNQKDSILPSQESNPINAPAIEGAGGNSGGGAQMNGGPNMGQPPALPQMPQQ